MTLGKREATAKVQLYFDLSWRVWPDWAEVRGEDETHHEFTPLLSRTYIQRSLTPEYGRRASTIKGITPPPAAGRSLRSLRGPCLHCIGINGLDIPQSKADQSRGQGKRNVRNLGRASERGNLEERSGAAGGEISPLLVLLVLVAKIKRRIGGVNSRTHTRARTHTLMCFALADQR